MRRRILIAEDEEDLVELFCLILGDQYELLTAPDGEQAVTLFQSHRPDLTLMDIRMPHKSGDVAIQEIHAIDPEARIVAITAYPYTEAELGVPVLRKGFAVSTLRDVVTEHLPPATEPA